MNQDVHQDDQEYRYKSSTDTLHEHDPARDPAVEVPDDARMGSEKVRAIGEGAK